MISDLADMSKCYHCSICLFVFLSCLSVFCFFSDKVTAYAGQEVETLTDERVQALKALGYFDRAETDNPKLRSVTKEAASAFDGLNLYGSRHRAEAYLMDMSGKVLHTWSGKSKRPPWMHMALLPDGGLLVISKGNFAAKLDWNSNIVWKRSMGAHHDITVGPDGKIYLLTHRVKRYMHRGVNIPIMDDHIVVLSPDGKTEKKQSLFSCLRPLVSKERLDKIAWRLKQGVSTKELIKEGAPADATHTNSLQVLPRPIPSIAPAGSILLSVREIDRIVILNAEMDRVLWSWGQGELEGQHHATLQGNGNILLFDNGVRRKQSRVIEMNPVTGKIEWSYTAPKLYSRLRGSAQKLPNGNVLIVESDKGHAIEVTRDGKKVWEFWNPDVRKSGDKATRAVIYRMMRYPLDYLKKGLLSEPR